jgi:hypothetical protein
VRRSLQRDRLAELRLATENIVRSRYPVLHQKVSVLDTPEPLSWKV